MIRIIPLGRLYQLSAGALMGVMHVLVTGSGVGFGETTRRSEYDTELFQEGDGLGEVAQEGSTDGDVNFYAEEAASTHTLPGDNGTYGDGWAEEYGDGYGGGGPESDAVDHWESLIFS